MDINRLSDLRPRFVWDILDDAFDFYRERFATLCGIAITVNLPLALINIGRAAVTDASPKASGASTTAALLETISLTYPLNLAAILVGSAATAVVLRDKLEGRPASTLSAAFRSVFRRPAPLIGSALLVAFLGLIGLLPIGLGTLAVYIYGSFLGPIVALEDHVRGTRAAWRRSVDLASDDLPKVIGVLFLMIAVCVAVALGLMAILELLYAVIPATGDAAHRELQKGIVSASSQNLAFVLLAPLPSAAISLLYFDLRVRREGIDLVALTEQNGIALASDPFGDTSSARVVRGQRINKKRGSRAKVAKAARQ